MNYNIISFLKKIKELNPDIQGYYFNVFPTNNMLQKEQNFDESEKKQIKTALNIREKLGFSFWESLMSTFLDNEDSNFNLLKNSLHHNKNLNISEISANDINKLELFIKKNKSNNLAFISQVHLSNGYKHLPLIDFHIKPSVVNQKTVEVVLNKLELNAGYLINSGKSYHFISKKLVNQNELEVLLAKMIFFSPIIDRNWIAHQLIEKKCALRVTKGEKTELKLVKEYSA